MNEPWTSLIWFGEVFSGYQPHQVSVWNWCFEDHRRSLICQWSPWCVYIYLTYCGWSHIPTFACPFLPTGTPPDCKSILMTGCVWLRLNPFWLSRCSWISMASFTRWSMYLVAVPSLEVLSKSTRWAVLTEYSATADFSGWLSQTHLMCLCISLS
jgi:hypothetical protein